ncbi:mycothiol synthase [Tsukamurella strandjordii]|uniref:Mycothiol acetyltransferase n=1 Tax=Tsukamurella strandjordii TaxID=147577 RepID=A0AA90NGU3_9ACTN|nr:mycothiol synthase [Tsukamurella strandjordii]MDP0398190.1 mycothiol synthase [Tsukamurella strandjordii]
MAAEVLHGPVPDPGAVLALAAEAAAIDGIGPLSEQFRLGVAGPGPHVLAPDDAGYAGIVIPPAGGAGAIEAVVAPGRRGRGLGRELVAAALDVAGDGATVWAHGDLPPARAVAAKLGLTPVRTLLNLRRPLTGLDPAPSAPDGVTVRTYAGPSDDTALLAVNNAAFAWHPEQGGWGPEQIAERVNAPWFDPAGLFLAVDDQGQLLGFHWTKVADPAAGIGEVYIVAVAPEGQGRGLGRLLTAAGLHYLADRTLDTVELYVEGDNTAALHTYTRLGFSEHERHVAYAQT